MIDLWLATFALCSETIWFDIWLHSISEINMLNYCAEERNKCKYTNIYMYTVKCLNVTKEHTKLTKLLVYEHYLDLENSK